jgi:hypothetical protein
MAVFTLVRAAAGSVAMARTARKVRLGERSGHFLRAHGEPQPREVAAERFLNAVADVPWPERDLGFRQVLSEQAMDSWRMTDVTDIDGPPRRAEQDPRRTVGAGGREPREGHQGNEVDEQFTAIHGRSTSTGVANSRSML